MEKFKLIPLFVHSCILVHLMKGTPTGGGGCVDANWESTNRMITYVALVWANLIFTYVYSHWVNFLNILIQLAIANHKDCHYGFHHKRYPRVRRIQSPYYLSFHEIINALPIVLKTKSKNCVFKVEHSYNPILL